MFAVCAISAIWLSAWGLGTYDIVKDIEPSIDGFVPRMTEIGNRVNTAELVFDTDDDDYGHQHEKLFGIFLVRLHKDRLYNAGRRPIQVTADGQR